MTFKPADELAAALLKPCENCGHRLLPYEDQKMMTALQVISLFDRDHDPIRKADGGPDVHWNLTWRFRPEHRKKSSRDASDMARERKVRRSVDRHMQNMLLKQPGKKPPRRSRIPSRPFRRREGLR